MPISGWMCCTHRYKTQTSQSLVLSSNSFPRSAIAQLQHSASLHTKMHFVAITVLLSLASGEPPGSRAPVTSLIADPFNNTGVALAFPADPAADPPSCVDPRTGVAGSCQTSHGPDAVALVARGLDRPMDHFTSQVQVDACAPKTELCTNHQNQQVHRIICWKCDFGDKPKRPICDVLSAANVATNITATGEYPDCCSVIPNC